jgi:putative flippase GtrA
MSTARQILHWATAPTEHAALQVPRALVVSILAAALDFGVLVLLVEQCNWSPAPAAVVGYLLGGVLQYVLCACWVFPTAPRNVTVGIAAFTLLSLVGLGITWATIELLHEQLQVNYVLAKFVALGLAFAWNFLSRKYLLFGSRPTDREMPRPDLPAQREEPMEVDDIKGVILPFKRIGSAPEKSAPDADDAETASAELEHIEA